MTGSDSNDSPEGPGDTGKTPLDALPDEVVEQLEEDSIELEEAVESEQPPTVWTEDEDFRIFPATSVFGGMQPTGQFQMEFVLDYGSDPGQEREITGQPPIGPLDDGGGLRIRQRQAAVTLTPQQAFSIGSWILSHVTDADQSEIEESITDNHALIFGGPEDGGVPLLIDREEFSEDKRERLDEFLTDPEGRERAQEMFTNTLRELVENIEKDE